MILMTLSTSEHLSKSERLYKKYRRFMFSAAYEVLQSEHLAEDAIHDAFEKIIKNLHKINESDEIKTKNFLVIICRNCAIDIYKQNKKQIPCENNILFAETVSPEEIVLTHDSTDKISQIIEQLPAIYRDVFMLHYYYNLSVSDISLLLKANLETIKKRLIRAKKQIAEKLKREGYYSDRQ